MDKTERYILIAILIIVIVIFYFVYNNKKDTISQSELLLAMAAKMQITPINKVVENLALKTENNSKTDSSDNEETEQDSIEIVRIAEKIYSDLELTKKEKEFESVFSEEIQEEVAYCAQFYPLVKKFVSGEKEFTDQEKEFYENHSDAIESELNKIKASQAIKDEGNNNPVIIPLLEASNVPEGGNPPLAQGERLKVILSFFEDSIPKTVTEISNLYSQKTGTIASKGNMSTIFGKLEGKELLWEKIKHNSRWKIFYGLPEWFDGKKLKKEYKQKI